jgi:tripartite-type tricarboxylate transporter receptor subunit TctC
MKKYWFVAGILLIGYLVLIAFLYLDVSDGKSYPNKPIVIVVHSKPGSAIDLMSRKIAELAGKYGKTAFVVENHPGTQGIVAMQYVMDRDADGYTLLGVTKSFISTLIVNKSNVSISDFTFLANMISDPEAIITNKKSGLNTIDDIIKQADELNGAQVWVGPGTGSRDHLMAMKTWKTLGIKAHWVDYKSGPQSILAMLRNEAPIYVGNPAETIGKRDLKILAIASANRLESLPEVPTFRENGYNLVESMWRGFAFKRGTPESAVKYLSGILEKISEDPEWITYCKDVFSFPEYVGPHIFSKRVKVETTETIQYLKNAGLLNSYIKKAILPLWLMGLIFAVLIFSILFWVFRFEFTRINFNIILSSIFLWISVFFFYQTMLFSIPEGLNITSPALIPRIWSVGLFIAVIWNIVNEWKGKNKPVKVGNYKLTGKIIMLLLIYFVAISYIGYYLSTPLFLISAMYVLKYRKWPLMIINALGFVLFSYLVFDILLKIELPLGSLL